MGTKYSTTSVSGYNSVPPSDDGTVSESNKVKWATIKTKLSDAIKTALESIDSKLTTHFNTGPTALTTNTTLGASHHNQFIQVSGSGVTLTLSDAATLAAGWYCWLRNTDSSNSVTIGRATGTDTFNGTAANYTLRPNEAILVGVNAAADGFITTSLALGDAQTIGGAWTFAGTVTMSAKAINEAKGSDIASATTTDIGAATGNFVDVTGTTTITALGTIQAGTRRVVRFTGALTLTHNATSLILPTAANILTVANDVAEFESLGSGNWQCTRYTRANGASVGGTDVQTFTSSGTWTKPSGYNASAMAYIQAWGGGGGGANGGGTGPAGGGGGGAYMERWMLLSALGATETITIGAGGTGSVGIGNGTAGGDTTVGTLLTAYGGGGGAETGGSGGGTHGIGTIGGGAGGTSGAPGAAGGNPSTLFGGGGAGGGSTAGDADGAVSVWGGGGGGADGTTASTGGGSLFGGAGGGSGVAGAQPGGGGNGRKSAVGLDGGAGKVIITVY